MATFAEQDSSDSSICNLFVGSTYSSDSSVESSIKTTIVFGQMFFQEFYGQFQNQYSSPSIFNQTGRLYTNVNSAYNTSYTGASVLSIGANPFVTPAVSTSSLLWLWITIGAGVLLLLIVIIIIICIRKNQEKKTQGYEYINTVEGSNTLGINNTAVGDKLSHSSINE